MKEPILNDRAIDIKTDLGFLRLRSEGAGVHTDNLGELTKAFQTFIDDLGSLGVAPGQLLFTMVPSDYDVDGFLEASFWASSIGEE